jgi:hypothetical protein
MGRRVAWHAQATPMHCRPHDEQMKKFSFRGRWLLTQVCSPLLGGQVRRLKCVVGPSHHFRPLHHQTPHRPPRWYAAVGHSTRASFDASECPRRYPLPLSSRGNPWRRTQTSGGRGLGQGDTTRCVGGVGVETLSCGQKKCSAHQRGVWTSTLTLATVARDTSHGPHESCLPRAASLSGQFPPTPSCHGRGVRVANTAVVSRQRALKLWLKLESAELDPNSFETF